MAPDCTLLNVLNAILIAYWNFNLDHKQSGVSIVVADALTSIWHQSIWNYHFDSGQSMHFRDLPT